ncbi:MAG: DNA-directed RNA polymerase subunit K [Nitrosopumilales archaeon]|nr:DNA-directed RNA polymerase subunit K [Nitrosopumilales archaeon]
MSEANDQEVVLEETEEVEEEPAVHVIQEIEEEPLVAQQVTDAITAYRKVREAGKEISEKEKEQIDKECKVIQEREVIEIDPVHEPKEMLPTGKVKVQIGPPTLTRFEKARIMGARALQLSLGAPPFIPIPKNARTSLDIAMEELEQKAIPITVRRVLPNGDYQNIPVEYFD